MSSSNEVIPETPKISVPEPGAETGQTPSPLEPSKNEHLTVPELEAKQEPKTDILSASDVLTEKAAERKHSTSTLTPTLSTEEVIKSEPALQQLTPTTTPSAKRKQLPLRAAEIPSDLWEAFEHQHKNKAPGLPPQNETVLAEKQKKNYNDNNDSSDAESVTTLGYDSEYYAQPKDSSTPSLKKVSPSGPSNTRPKNHKDSDAVAIPESSLPKAQHVPHADGSIDPSSGSDSCSKYSTGSEISYEYVPSRYEREQLLWVRKNLMVLTLALGQLITDENAKAQPDELQVKIAHDQKFYTEIKPILFHYKNTVDATIQLYDEDFIADELPTGFLHANERERKLISEECYRKRQESETPDSWQSFDIRQLQYCWRAVFDYAVLLGSPEINKALMQQLVCLERSLSGCDRGERYLKETWPSIQQALQEIEIAKDESRKGIKLLKRFIKEKQQGDCKTKDDATKKRKISRKEGLSFPYYDAAEEGMTAVGDFITKFYGLREFAHNLFLIMAANPQVPDEKLPPKFRSLWNQPEEQTRIGAEYYALALWTKKARMLYRAGIAPPDIFNQVFWYLNELVEDTPVADISLPLKYREGSTEERRKLSFGCTVQALMFFQELKRVRKDWRMLVIKRRWDPADHIETIFDSLERLYEYEIDQSINLEILLPPGYCSLAKKVFIASDVYFLPRRALLECWTFNVLRHIVQWLFVDERWQVPPERVTPIEEAIYQRFMKCQTMQNHIKNPNTSNTRFIEQYVLMKSPLEQRHNIIKIPGISDGEGAEVVDLALKTRFEECGAILFRAPTSMIIKEAAETVLDTIGRTRIPFRGSPLCDCKSKGHHKRIETENIAQKICSKLNKSDPANGTIIEVLDRVMEPVEAEGIELHKAYSKKSRRKTRRRRTRKGRDGWVAGIRLDANLGEDAKKDSGNKVDYSEGGKNEKVACDGNLDCHCEVRRVVSS
ncbi:hypothetical protein EG329_014136 [Mollisiaceae sp. DMI_Dod_QoI]|nr:hypothetical protein EG329_014136 [Helotiales sp. DMI_Dod_QoI]